MVRVGDNHETLWDDDDDKNFIIQSQFRNS